MLTRSILNVISFTPAKTSSLPYFDFHKLSSVEEEYLKVSYTERHSNGRVDGEYKTEIYLDPSVKCGFHCNHFHETHIQRKKSK